MGARYRIDWGLGQRVYFGGHGEVLLILLTCRWHPIVPRSAPDHPPARRTSVIRPGA
jgi:putative component of toxin-antitoxin plasmid stabilization module